MLCYDRINTSKGIDVNKSNRSKEYMLCYYKYFLDTGYRYKPKVCNGCHNNDDSLRNKRFWNTGYKGC